MSILFIESIDLSVFVFFFFFSDVLLYRPVTNADYPALEKVSESAIKEKQKFERLVVSKEKLLEMFNVRQLFLVFLF